MNLAQIKAKLGIVSLDLSRTLDKDKQPTKWLRYWNNDERFAVVIHDDVVAKIKADPSLNTLALKHEVKETKDENAVGDTYDSYIIIHASSIEVVL